MECAETPTFLAKLFINCFKEQRAQTKQQRTRQKSEIELLKKRKLEFAVLKRLVCSRHANATAIKVKSKCGDLFLQLPICL
jgi:hypothetical protein